MKYFIDNKIGEPGDLAMCMIVIQSLETDMQLKC